MLAIVGLLLLLSPASPLPPPTLDHLWASAAHFSLSTSLPLNSPNFSQIDAGTRVVVVAGTWYLFGRYDTGPTPKCPSGEISINVRASTDFGRHWTSPPHPIAKPDEVATCIYADGSAFFNPATQTWHYLVQVLDVNATGGWMLAHFFLANSPTPFGAWTANPRNPVVRGGDLFNRICAGPGKHCAPGMVDEGTPDIVEMAGGEFYVTFHGYDYARKRGARGVARTADFVAWEVAGGANPLPADAIFSSLDCAQWRVPWDAASGCIGSGEASILRAPSGFMYQVIEAADKELGCETGWGSQWWPLGLVRSRDWAPSGAWEQMAATPFVGGPGGGEPHVGCSIQYNSLHLDPGTGTTWLALWDVSFHPANASSPAQTWHLYELVWGEGPPLPMAWPGPPQAPPGQPDCGTKAACKASCSGFAECASDGWWYCCADAVHCGKVHDCAGSAGLHYCACGA